MVARERSRRTWSIAHGLCCERAESARVATVAAVTAIHHHLFNSPQVQQPSIEQRSLDGRPTYKCDCCPVVTCTELEYSHRLLTPPQRRWPAKTATTSAVLSMGAAVSWLLQQSQNRLSDKRSIVFNCIFAIAGCVGYISSIQWLYHSNYRVASNAFVPQTANTGQFQHKAATQLFLHPNSSLKDDVLSIVHHPQEAAISIQFKENASCPHPYLRGRLSGPALVVLGEWTYQNRADGANMLSGIYRAPYPGHYFLEIIAIFCDDFSRNQAHITPNSSALWESEVDFSRICTQPSSQRQLTSSNAVIDVTKASLEGLEGNWLWNGSIHTPLYTRYQQPGCYKGSNVPECTNSRTSVEPFADYSWQFMNPSEPLSIQNFDPPPVAYNMMLNRG